jgi:hypothetical protein
VRNTKIRYNITSDEQSRFRTRNRRPVQKKEEENIEYQRDVLNQNYPSSVYPPVVTSSTEKLIESIHIHSDTQAAEHVNDYNAPVESVEVIPLGGNIPLSNENHIDNQYTPDNPLYYENTIDTTTSTTSTTQRTPIPRNHKYSNDQETYQIPQHKVVSHRLKGNFNFNRNTDSFYNAKPQDTTVVTPRHVHEDDEILVTAPTTQAPAPTTTTSEAPETEAPIPRRTPIPRRRLYTTTTESASEPESYGVRIKFL